MKLTKRIRGRFFLFLLACGYSSISPADVYRWVDNDGQVHFGEQPPTDVEAEEVKPPPPPALSPDMGSERRQQFEQRQADYTKSRREAKEAEQKAADEAAERADKCAQSRAAVASINQFMNKRMFDENGNYIEQPAREQKLKKAEESVAFWCD